MRNENICEGNVLTFKPRHYYTINRKSYEVELNSNRKLVETAKYLASLTIPCSSSWEPNHPESALIKALVLCGYMDFNSSGETVSGTDLVMPEDDNSLVEEIFASVSHHFAPPKLMADIVLLLKYNLSEGLRAIMLRRNINKFTPEQLMTIAPQRDRLERIADEMTKIIRLATFFSTELKLSNEAREGFATEALAIMGSDLTLRVDMPREIVRSDLETGVLPALHEFFKQAIVGPSI